MGKYILALDQGTTSSRAILFDSEQNILAIRQHELTQHYPHEGWVEQDPMEIWSTQYAAMLEVLAAADVSPSDVAGIGITNQRETTILWDKNTGRPIHNAIVWQCRRTADIVDRLVQDGLSTHIRRTTGLVPDAYFSGTKIKWLLDHVEGAREKAERGEILFGTVDSWLVWKLTGGKVHITDATNAARTMIFDIHRLDWDDTLLHALDIPRAMLPRVCSSSEVYGSVSLPGGDIPIAGIAGDQQAALFGQTCFAAGDAKNTYGTGCFLLMNTGTTACESENGLLTTIGIQISGETQYALEGSVFVGGAVIQWLRDEMRFFSESRDAEYYAGKVKDTGGVYLVPAFTGLGYVRTRLSHRSDARHDPRAHHPRRTGVHRLSGERPADRHETRYRHCPLLPVCGRRCQPRQLPDAVPERYFGLHDSPSGHPRNDRARRMLSCWTRDRCVAQPRGAEAALAVRYAVCALDGRE